MPARDTWSAVCEKALNEQIKVEYMASYHYHLLAAHFYTLDAGLMKLGEYFNKASLEERGHADKLMRYQTMRGGKVTFSHLPVPELKLEKKTEVQKSFELALELEESVNRELIKLHKVAEECGDAQFSDFLEGEFLEEQVEAIADLSRVVSQLNLIGDDGHGIWALVNNLDEE